MCHVTKVTLFPCLKRLGWVSDLLIWKCDNAGRFTSRSRVKLNHEAKEEEAIVWVHLINAGSWCHSVCPIGKLKQQLHAWQRKFGYLKLRLCSDYTVKHKHTFSVIHAVKLKIMQVATVCVPSVTVGPELPKAPDKSNGLKSTSWNPERDRLNSRAGCSFGQYG